MKKIPILNKSIKLTGSYVKQRFEVVRFTSVNTQFTLVTDLICRGSKIMVIHISTY